MPISTQELSGKIARLHGLMEEKSLDAILLRKISSGAWISGARTFINTAADIAEASFLLLADGSHTVITNNIEALRLRSEEKLEEAGWKFEVADWYGKNDIVERLTQGKKVGTDAPTGELADLSLDITRMRADLTVEEVERFRKCGTACAEAVEVVMNSIQPGQTQYEIAAKLAYECGIRNIQPIVQQVSSDDRTLRVRHAIPTSQRVDKYALVALCGRSEDGLVVSISRVVHFGQVPEDLAKKLKVVATVDAAFILNTKPGKKFGEIFDASVKYYDELGFPDEWTNMHQGGDAAYEPRERLVKPGSEEIVFARQAFEYNPSVPGIKSEDTVIITDEGYEVITSTPNLPTIEVEVNGQKVIRPGILVKT